MNDPGIAAAGVGADVRLGLEHHDFEPAQRQCPCRGESCHTGADDDAIGLFHVRGNRDAAGGLPPCFMRVGTFVSGLKPLLQISYKSLLQMT